MWRYRVPVTDFLALRDNPAVASSWHGNVRFEGPGTSYGIIECDELFDAAFVIANVQSFDDLPARVVWP